MPKVKRNSSNLRHSSGRALIVAVIAAILYFMLSYAAFSPHMIEGFTYEDVCPPRIEDVSNDVDAAGESSEASESSESGTSALEMEIAEELRVIPIDDINVPVVGSVLQLFFFAPVDGKYVMSIEQNYCYDSNIERYWIVDRVSFDCLGEQVCRYPIPTLPNAHYAVIVKPVGDNWGWSPRVSFGIQVDDNPASNNKLHFEPDSVPEVVFDGVDKFSWDRPAGADAFRVYFLDPSKGVYTRAEVITQACNSTECVMEASNVEAMVPKDGIYSLVIWAYGPQGANMRSSEITVTVENSG